MFPKFFHVLSDLLLILFQVINPVNEKKSPEKKFEERVEPQFEVGTKNYRDMFYTYRFLLSWIILSIANYISDYVITWDLE